MNINEFNDTEAEFIATEIILKRLEVQPSGAHQRISHSNALKKTLRRIESLEDVWEYNPTDGTHTYGRKEHAEPIRFWSFPAMTASVLEHLVVHTHAKTILEIGTSAGYSTLHLANGATYTNGRVYTIEILEEKAKIAQEHFKEAGLEKSIELLYAEASTILKTWNQGNIELVFLDADKEKYGKYLELLIPLMSQGGIIIADNINDYGHLMQDYLQKVTGTHLPQSRCDRRVVSTYVAQLDNGIMVTKKL